MNMKGRMIKHTMIELQTTKTPPLASFELPLHPEI
jgi:hypothetical protein